MIYYKRSLFLTVLSMSCTTIALAAGQERYVAPSSSKWRMTRFSDLPKDDKIIWKKFHNGMIGRLNINLPCRKNYNTVESLIKTKNGKLYQIVKISKENGAGDTIFGPMAVSSPYILWKKYTSKLIDINGASWNINQETIVIEKLESAAFTYGCINGKPKLIQTTG